MGLLNKMIIALVNRKVAGDGRKVRARLERMTLAPMKTQEDFLMGLLCDNKDTEFGRKYDFASIHSIEEYRRRVPVSSYDDYAEAIYRMVEKGEKNLLTAYPVNHYSKSSGTMGNPKRIPFSDRAAGLTSDYVKSYMYALLEERGLLGLDPSLTLVESILTTLPNGATCGAYSAKESVNNQFFISRLFTPPFEVMTPKGNMNSRHLHAFYALKERNLSSGLSGFYSYFLEVIGASPVASIPLLAWDRHRGVQRLYGEVERIFRAGCPLRDVWRNRLGGCLFRTRAAGFWRVRPLAKQCFL